MESFIFLGLILLVGAVTQNKSIVYATIFVLILKVLFNITESCKLKGIDIENFMTQFRKEGINWGVLIITVAILIPIATGEIGFSHLLNAFKSSIGWVAIISGITVSILSSKGVGLLSGQPEITVALVIGTIMGVVFFKGIAAGPVIASGITFCILRIIELVFKR
ncbi:DUF441 domain-containing protein [Leptotrichia trevisanii]|uniref:Uncharacterized protein n=1 Tax=Leptotrichia trevisanii TaxID=109328 RepID=A0A510K315_9FUSO|nr:DUF441 domain-containing protein [Leptotrichia trevisanii]BBM46070.1 hypothetical protein JMUB3870_2197 [Leptotrichia trevisanii]